MVDPMITDGSNVWLQGITRHCTFAAPGGCRGRRWSGDTYAFIPSGCQGTSGDLWGSSGSSTALEASSNFVWTASATKMRMRKCVYISNSHFSAKDLQQEWSWTTTRSQMPVISISHPQTPRGRFAAHGSRSTRSIITIIHQVLCILAYSIRYIVSWKCLIVITCQLLILYQYRIIILFLDNGW